MHSIFNFLKDIVKKNVVACVASLASLSLGLFAGLSINDTVLRFPYVKIGKISNFDKVLPMFLKDINDLAVKERTFGVDTKMLALIQKTRIDGYSYINDIENEKRAKEYLASYAVSEKQLLSGAVDSFNHLTHEILGRSEHPFTSKHLISLVNTYEEVRVLNTMADEVRKHLQQLQERRAKASQRVS